MFFENYTENLWGRHPSQIDPSWGAQRVKGVSVLAVVKNALLKPFRRKGGAVETSLIEEFSYPKLGPGQLWDVTAEEIRKLSEVPIIMLTAKSEEKDELKGFSLGVDEYITKPFSPRVLVARVSAILRRTTQEETVEILEAGGINLDVTAHQVRVDGKLIELSFKEFELLQFFMKNQGMALSREKILNSVWNYDYYGDARTIDTHVKKLRAKLGDKGRYIHTIWAMGYKFDITGEQ